MSGLDEFKQRKTCNVASVLRK